MAVDREQPSAGRAGPDAADAGRADPGSGTAAGVRGKLSVVDLTHRYKRKGEEVVAIRDINLQVNEGEFVAIVGPSGCGKSTLLNILSGLLRQTSGEVYLDGVLATDLLGQIGYMPQQDLLLPWKSVSENASLGMRFANVGRRERHCAVEEEAEFFGLKGFEDAWPSQLSGGMRQRAALLRTFLANRDVMLLDEPFGAIDAMTRHAMHMWLLDLWTRTRKTIVFVTHDVDEAVLLADRVYVLTSRPGSTAGYVRIDLERPRAPDVALTERFVELKRNVSELLGGL